jgi:hypothetical protein
MSPIGAASATGRPDPARARAWSDRGRAARRRRRGRKSTYESPGEWTAGYRARDSSGSVAGALVVAVRDGVTSGVRPARCAHAVLQPVCQPFPFPGGSGGGTRSESSGSATSRSSSDSVRTARKPAAPESAEHPVEPHVERLIPGPRHVRLARQVVSSSAGSSRVDPSPRAERPGALSTSALAAGRGRTSRCRRSP